MSPTGEGAPGRWRCPEASTRPAAQYLAEKLPSEYLDEAKRYRGEWLDVAPCDDSRIDGELLAKLGELGLRPKLTYRVESRFGVPDENGVLVPPVREYEHWRSDDDITSATVMLVDEDAKFISIKTRFEGPRLLSSAPIVPLFRFDWVECLRFERSFDHSYRAHREQVKQRIVDGDVALSIAADEDRRAFARFAAQQETEHTLGDIDPVDVHKTDGFGFLDFVGMLPWFVSAATLGVIALVVAAIIFLLDDAVWWLVTWWPIALIAALPSALSTYVVLTFQGHLNWLDHKYPDSLDEHAGYWLKGRVAAEGLADHVQVGKAQEGFLSELDAYLPLRNKIVLGERTYEKQDPTFWAIAAHELGHAVDRHRRRLMQPIALLSRVGLGRTMYWVYAGLLACTVMGWSAAINALPWFIGSALFFGSFVLFDEAVASIIGLRILGQDERVTNEMMPDMRRHLGLAFASYCAPLVGLLITLLGWEWIAAFLLENVQFHPAKPLEGAHLLGANVLSVVVAVGVFFAEKDRVARWLRRLRGAPVAVETEDEDEEDVDLRGFAFGCGGVIARLVVTLLFFLTVWDQPLGGWFQVAAFVYVPLVLIFFSPVMIPVNLLLRLPKTVVKRLGFVPKPPEQPPGKRLKAAAEDVVHEIQILDPRQSSPWYLDIYPGIALHALPLVALWWASQL